MNALMYDEHTFPGNMLITAGAPDDAWSCGINVLNSIGIESNNELLSCWLDENQPHTVGNQGQVEETLTKVPIDHYSNASELTHKHLSKPHVSTDPRVINALDEIARYFPATRFVMFFSMAETAIAHSLLQQAEPASVMENWLSANVYLMQFRRKYRNRVILLNAEDALSNANGVRTAIEGLGFELPQTVSTMAEAHRPKPLERLIAQHFLQPHSKVKEIEAELVASSQPLKPYNGSQDLQNEELIRDLFSRGTCTQTLRSPTSDTKETPGDTAEQLLRPQDNTESYETDHATSRDGVPTEEETVTLLTMLVHRVQEELENRTLDQERTSAEYRALQEKHSALLSEYQILASQSSTQQFYDSKTDRTESELIDTTSAYRDLADDNSLLLLQLHQVQEQLESYFIKSLGISVEQAQNPLVESAPAKRELEQKARTLRPSSRWFSFGLPFNLHHPRIDKRISSRDIKRHAKLIDKAGLFDRDWYLSQYPDVAQSGMDPIRHYLRHGANESRNPSPYFNTRFYVQANPDVAESSINPLLHYIMFGIAEGRKTTPNS